MGNVGAGISQLNDNDFILIFDDSVKNKLIDAIGYKVSSDSFIVDTNGRQLTDTKFKKIMYKDFGGVLIGSKISIRKDEQEIIDYFLNKK